MSKSPPPTSADRKSRIVRSAFGVLLAEGLPHLSYDRIASEAGVTRQLVRYHFADPDDLMIALCDLLAGTYREVLIQGVAGRADKDRLRVFLDFYFDLLDGVAKPRDDQVYDALFSLAAGSPTIRRNLRDQYTLLGQALTHELRTSYPAIPLASCGEIAYLFVALMYGHWKMVATLGLAPCHRFVARRAIDRIIASYARTPEPVAGVTTWKAAESP